MEPRSIDYLLMTHVHLDHCGLIPRLTTEGFNQPILTIEPSVKLAEIIMLDAGRIQEEDAAYKKQRHTKEGHRSKHPDVPLYTLEDAKNTVPLCRANDTRTPYTLTTR